MASYNPERRAWRGRSHKRGGERVRDLKEKDKFVLKHAKCDLYVAERAGSWARWGDRNEAMELTKDEWEKELSPTLNRDLIVFEPVKS